jgi:hypothetical protein
MMSSPNWLKVGLRAYYQEQQDDEEQPLPQQVQAPGVNATACAPSWQVDPILLLKVTIEGENWLPLLRSLPSSPVLICILPPVFQIELASSKNERLLIFVGPKFIIEISGVKQEKQSDRRHRRDRA